MARKAGCSTLVVLEVDATEVTIEDVRPRIESRLRQRLPLIAVSAKTGRGSTGCSSTRLLSSRSTPAGSRRHAEQRARRAAPGAAAALAAGKRLNLLYGAQVSTRLPRIRIHVNDPGLVTRDYAYWVENELRKRFSLVGVPVSIDFVKRS